MKKKLYEIEVKLKVKALGWTKDDAKAVGLSMACSTPLVQFDIIGAQAFDQSIDSRMQAVNAEWEMIGN